MRLNSRTIGLSLALLQTLASFKVGYAHKFMHGTFHANATTESDGIATTESFAKKGVGAWYSPSVESVLKDLGVSWYYTWSISTSDQSIQKPAGIKYVPQFYSAADVTDANLKLVETKDNDESVLTFNEPDRADQGLTSVEDAIAVWPKLETLSKRLSAPVMTTRGLASPWFQKFFALAVEKKLRIDFMAINYYNNDPARWVPVEVAVKDMKVTLENIYRKYGRPIWVTEFGLAKWSDPKIATYPTPEVQAEFVTKACAMMDQLDFVERYAYFPIFPYTANSLNHLALPSSGKLTVVGEAYKKA